MSRRQACRRMRQRRAHFRNSGDVSEPKNLYSPSIPVNVHRTIFPDTKALGRRPTRDDHSARSARNREGLHSEASGRLAPETGETACRAVVRFWKSPIKCSIFQQRSAPIGSRYVCCLPPRNPAVGEGTIPPQCGGNVAQRQKGTARVRGGQSAPQQGIFKGTVVPLNGLLLPFLPTRKGRAGRGLGKIPPRGGGNVAKRQRGTARVRAA